MLAKTTLGSASKLGIATLATCLAGIVESKPESEAGLGMRRLHERWQPQVMPYNALCATAVSEQSKCCLAAAEIARSCL